MKSSGRCVGQSPAAVSGSLTPGWLQPRDTLQQLLQRAGVEKVLEVWNHISPELAVSRYASRLQDRKPGHPGEEYLPELAQLAQQAEPMRLGPVFTVDQHKPLDMASATRWIEAQIA